MKKVSIKNIQKKKKGFTLVELIIVIAIIAILAAMAIPKFSAVRLDARVSNDVAAAKNIQTITATLIGNGTITPTAAVQKITVSANADIKDRLDGKAKDGMAEALPGKSFTVEVDGKENITVKVDGKFQLYPEVDGDAAGKGGKIDYLAEVKK